MFQILYIMFLVFIGWLAIAGFCRLYIGKSVCDIYGHDWERISLDVEYYKKKNVLEIIEKYKCKNCGKTKTERHIDIIK